ncbi:MAG TPA: response regulator [Draconibacterium sp.]|nr:response regulator [Draconibacterium sp.]
MVLIGLAGVLQSFSFFKPNQIRYIFVIYLLTVISEALLQPYLTPHPEITPSANLLLFVLHLLVIAFSSFNVLSMYINQSIEIKKWENKRLQELDTLKTNFYTNITHEFRTPLTVILGMTDQIIKKPGKYFEKGMQLIRQNGMQLLRLVNQMLDLSKLEAKSMQVHDVQKDIVPFLRQAIEPFSHLAETKNIQIHFQMDVNELWMDFDPEKMESLIGNLLSNAIKYSNPDSEIYFTASEIRGNTITDNQYFSPMPVKTIHSEKALKLTFIDSGIGIPETELPRIFNRFYQVENLDSKHYAGAGIGLLLVKETVDLLNGNLFVKSNPGKGSEFVVFLPLANKAQKIEIDGKTSIPEFQDKTYIEDQIDSYTHLTKDLPHLLILEDNDDVVTYLRSVVDTKFQVARARDGVEGIKMALEIVPDIILSDVMMPKKDGYEVCQTLKKNFRTSHIPIILLTAKADNESKIEGLKYGADAYLTKPFDSNELLIRLEKLIEIREKLKTKYRTLAITAVSNSVKPANPDEIFLKKLKENLEKYYEDDNFDTNQLIRKIGMSRVQLFRKLKALTDMSATHFIRLYRLSRAKEKILTTQLNISEIAYEVGFKDPAYFTRSFSKEFGIPPSALRE